MSGSQLQDQLLLCPQVNCLLMTPPAQIPEVDMSTVLAVEKQVRDQPIFNHVRSAPLTGNHGIVSKMPPKIISQILWSAFHFPLTEHVEGVVIEQKDAARSLTFG